MRFNLNIESGAAAFAEDPEIPLGAILRTLAYRLEEGETSGKIRDANGNTVGKFKLEVT